MCDRFATTKAVREYLKHSAPRPDPALAHDPNHGGRGRVGLFIRQAIGLSSPGTPLRRDALGLLICFPLMAVGALGCVATGALGSDVGLLLSFAVFIASPAGLVVLGRK